MYTVTESKRRVRGETVHTFDVVGVLYKGKPSTMRFVTRTAAQEMADRLNTKPTTPTPPASLRPRLTGTSLIIPAPAIAKIRQGRFTVVLPSGEHVSLSVGVYETEQVMSVRRQNHWETVGMMSGENIVLWLDSPGLTRGNFPSVRAALEGIEKDPIDAAFTYALESQRCFRCGKELTEPTSILRGIGPDCLEALTGQDNRYWSPAEKAALKERILMREGARVHKGKNRPSQPAGQDAAD